MEESSEIVIESKKKPFRRKYIIVPVIIFLCLFAGLIYRTMTWESKPDQASEIKIRQEVARKFFLETRDKRLTIDPNILTGKIDVPRGYFYATRYRRLVRDPNSFTEKDFVKIGRLTIGFKAGEVGDSPYPYIYELTDIKLLEQFTNLQYLRIHNIRPLNNTSKWMSLLLKHGIFNHKEILALDLSPLNKLNNLETLFIQGTPVKSLKPVPNIQELSLYVTPVYNLEVVKKMKNLKRLEISGIQVSDIKPIKGLKNLQRLRIIFTPVSSLEPIKGLKNLQYLYIRGCENISDEQVGDLQKALPNLEIIQYEKQLWH